MSRHVTNNADGVRFVYGFDRPLCEYFLQKYLPNGEITEIVGTLGRLPGTNGNLLQAIQDNGVQVPEDHIDLITMDFPI